MRTWGLLVFLCLGAGRGSFALPCFKSLAAIVPPLKVSATAAKGYSREVWRTRGGRILVKKKYDDPKAHSSHFLREYEKPRDPGWLEALAGVGQILPRKITKHYLGKPYDLTWVEGLTHHLLKRPTRWMTRKLIGEERDPTVLITLPLELWFLSFVSTSVNDARRGWVEAQRKKRAIRRVAEQKDDYDMLIASDFRYRDIRDALRGDMPPTPEHARLMAAANRTIEQTYFKFRAEEKNQEPGDARDFYLSLPFFADIDSLELEGFHREGFVYGEGFVEEPAPETIDKLIQMRHALMVKYQLVWAWAHDPEQYRDLTDTPKIRNAMSAFLDEPFAKELIELQRKRKITKTELSYRLQEELYWKNKFAEWQVLSVRKLRKVGDGFTNELLEPEDIHAEIRAELTRDKNSP